MGIEREVKLGASTAFRLPDFGDLGPDVKVVPRSTQILLAVYHDTPDLRLARWGVTLRHRSGDGSKWTVKLPEGDDGPALVRRELDFEGPADRMPAPAAAVVLAYARGVPLVPVAQLRTERSGVDLIGGDGTKVAEIVDDEVSVIHDGQVAARFREVEVELGEGAAAGLLDTLVSRLRGAGAGAPDSTPKVFRALGPRALGRPDVDVPAVARNATAAGVVTQAIASSVVAILRHDPGVRIGENPEDVHQAWVGARRLRFDLRTFGPILDEAWLTPLRDDLRWFAGLLGEVRDVDVLDDRLRRQAAGVAQPYGEVLAPLFGQLATEREEARSTLAGAMTSPRYIALLDELVAGARAPRFAPGSDRPAGKALPELVAWPWKRLRAEVRRLPPDPSADDLHQVRTRAERARYAVEAVGPLGGKRAGQLADALADLQVVLGDHHDAVVAEGWLRWSLSSAAPAVQEAAQELVVLQRSEAEASRRRWRPAWEMASAKRLRSWL
ncbi:MAG: CHAD domain-containing protein [Acidimicrobiales bacterium]